MVDYVSATLLTKAISSWLAAHPDELLDRARVERLNVAQVLRSSNLIATDISDAALAEAALLFPRHQQVSLFRFFCHVRAWSLAQGSGQPEAKLAQSGLTKPGLTKPGLTEPSPEPARAPAGSVATAVRSEVRVPRVPTAALNNARPAPPVAPTAATTATAAPNRPPTPVAPTAAPSVAEPVVVDLAGVEPQTATSRNAARATSAATARTAGSAAPPAAVLIADAPSRRTGGVPGTVAYEATSVPQRTRVRGGRPDPKLLAAPRAGMRCPHSAEDLADMPARRASIAAFEFDVFVDTTWAHVLSVAATAARLAGDPSWTIETHSGSDNASLWYHSNSTAAPSIHTTLSYAAGVGGSKVSFRIVEVHASGWRSLLSRRDQSRPARVLARKLAWGFLPSQPAQEQAPRLESAAS